MNKEFLKKVSNRKELLIEDLCIISDIIRITEVTQAPNSVKALAKAHKLSIEEQRKFLSELEEMIIDHA